MSRRGAAGFSYHSLLSRGWTLCRREGHRVQLRYPAFPSSRALTKRERCLAETYYENPAPCFGTSGRIFRFNKALRRSIAGVTNQ
jgi:hypothetical protein